MGQAAPHSHLIACIWDFDKTLIPGYMQKPLFAAYNVDEKRFWAEVKALPTIYRKRGIPVSEDMLYLNHLLTYVKNGPLRGLNNQKLRMLGAELELFPGLPDFFKSLKDCVRSKESYVRHDLHLEHYIISNGLAEMIRGSQIAPWAEGIYGCEFLEEPLLPGFDIQGEIIFSDETKEISQIARMVDNTIKTRFLFELNKGTNKNPAIDVNAAVPAEDRRILMQNMIYIADGPTDVPMFAVIRDRGGKAFAVHHPDNVQEFMQNDTLLESGRIDCYGPADYRPQSHTHRWIKMHVEKIADRIVEEREAALKMRISRPPYHGSTEGQRNGFIEQASLFETKVN